MDTIPKQACDKLADLTLFAPTCSTGKRDDYISWEDYFMAMALLSAKRSKDPVTQVGACIVDENNRIVAIGYNGFPRNCPDDKFPWCKLTDDPKGDPMNDKRLYVVHAEANAIINKNIASLAGTRLYTTLFPCNECTKLIIQVGISEIYFISDKYAEKVIYRASKRMLDAAGITYTRFQPRRKQITIDFNSVIQNELNSVLGYKDTVEDDNQENTEKDIEESLKTLSLQPSTKTSAKTTNQSNKQNTQKKKVEDSNDADNSS